VATVAECPACLGDGEHDFTDDDAQMGEHMSPEALALLNSRGLYPLGVVQCEECEGTGIVSDDRAADLHAAAVAAVDQIVARATHGDRCQQGGEWKRLSPGRWAFVCAAGFQHGSVVYRPDDWDGRDPA